MGLVFDFPQGVDPSTFKAADWQRAARRASVTPSASSVTPAALAESTTDLIDETATTAAQEAASAAQAAAITAAAGLASDAQASAETTAASLVAVHSAAPDPHPAYQTQIEGDARYVRLSNVLAGSKTHDPASLADGAHESTTVTVTGAVLGDFAVASFSLSTQGIMVTAEVTAADTVTVNLFNKTGGTIDLASGTLRARVWKN